MGKATTTGPRLPEGRTRLTTEEVCDLLDMASGCKYLLLKQANALGIRPEWIGNSRTYSRDDIARLAAALAEVRVEKPWYGRPTGRRRGPNKGTLAQPA